MQAAAAEALTIRVIFAAVKTAETPTALITAVVAKAEVLAVARSATRLSPGATIQIRYTTRTEKRPMAGPSPVSVLSDGERCSAFLSKATDGDSYQPAAGGRTFESVR